MVKNLNINYKLNDEQFATLILDLQVEIDDFAIYSTDDQLKNFVKGILTACYHTYSWSTYEEIETIINHHMDKCYDMYILI